ncbi:MAG: DUF47 family protein [Paludibacteraceae bacterium]|nr:DUF47 family protein [Paludibacteraceae bacterium]
MRFNSIFSFLVPKESTFFPLFKKSGDLLVDASDLLVEFLKTQDKEQQKEIYKKIKEAETKCDGVTNKIFDELNNIFITPFDREDIRELADLLDDVIDFINSSAKRVVLYQPNELPEKALQLGEIISKGCHEICDCMYVMSQLNNNSQLVLEKCTHMKSLEKEADDIYEHFIIELFQKEESAIDVIRLTQIMSELEKATNSINGVSKELKTILIKYA